MQLPPPKKPHKFPVPYGLFIVLAVYALCVLGYIWTNYWDSPEYKAALGYARALSILGVDDGRKCTEAQLVKAFEATLEAARLMPDERQLVDHLESLRHRFEERKFKLNPDLVKKAEMMSANTMRIEKERKAWLVVGSRDRGWAPDQLLAGPERVVLWSIPGGVLIIAFWAYTRFSGKAARDRDHEEDLKKAEREVEELGDFRRGLGSRPAPKVEDDADTLAQSPPVRARPKTASGVRAVTRPPSLTARPAVKKRPPEE
ncbi:MAG: hypothetical protein Q8N23_19880 [Archangium sp.]|nr:hypothetical protein [Archangium sp.]MDP3154949.1 hypothetical protein [Archangium sp.]MDP3576068.1 hypothetical protein [Archangium sp.]